MISVDVLRKAGIFKGFSDGDLTAILQKAAFMEVGKGSYIFYRGDPSDGVYFVVEGSVQVIIDSDDKREIIVYSVDEGDILGELSIFENHSRSATAIAITDARLLRIANDDFVDTINRRPSVAINLSKILVDRLRAANVMIERMGTMDGARRVADFVKALAVREGTLQDGAYVLPKPAYGQISHRLGISEKTVYRTMRQMTADGKITIKGRGLIVPKNFVNSRA
ncbi:MAG: Crp/Fnr family transcriptional regulator [Nitrospinae bacterium]|nr:Crp/Fnr family transcriptional regulator [Nitrospinota bacterium]MBF0633873.1 Crp/Fnr family transcriptional regulator [Nitrospinota bacterium]